MSRFLPSEVFELDRTPQKAAPAPAGKARLLDPKGWVLLGMGLAGILTVALIVSADRTYAGIDGLRAVNALVPVAAEQPAITKVPFLGGIISAIHDAAPSFFAPSPDSVLAKPTAAPAPPADSPSSSAEPTPLGVPAVHLPGASTPPSAPVSGPPGPTAPSSSAPGSGPGATAPPAPTGTPTATAAPTVAPSPTPVPVLSITSDRGGVAIVNLTGLLPGDSMDRTITIQNGGNLGFTYTVSATHTASTLLWTDQTDGLQLTVSTSGGSVLYSGPLSGLGSVAGPTTLAPSAGELLRYTFDFPPTAPNTFQGLVQDLTLVFVAVESP